MGKDMPQKSKQSRKHIFHAFFSNCYVHRIEKDGNIEDRYSILQAGMIIMFLINFR